MKKKYMFKTPIAHHTFYGKYALTQAETWNQRSRTVVDDICGVGGGKYDHPILGKDEQDYLVSNIESFKFIPAGRYLYYAGRIANFYNNCYCFGSQQDTREDWADTAYKHTAALMTGGGTGNVYSVYRPNGRLLNSTGGIASGPLPAMAMVNEIGRNVRQGGSRRSACWAGLHWWHDDISDFLTIKNWSDDLVALKANDFNFPAPLDMTNISVIYDDEFLDEVYGEWEWVGGKSHRDILVQEGAKSSIPEVFLENVYQALSTGEPGLSFDFGPFNGQHYRNACTEFTSDEDGDCCNLGSVNLGAIESIDEFKDVVRSGARFLVCGSVRADVPLERTRKIREEKRKIGLGLMGIHEWLLKRGYRYEMNDELREWLSVYRDESEAAANEHCDRLYISRPVSYRAIAPNGTTGILASTTTGIEPLYAVSYKRRYLDGLDNKWKYEYVVDGTADFLIKEYGLEPESIETALDLSNEPERRIKFQADVQGYVDMGISSTINLPAWGSKENNPDTVPEFTKTLLKYAHKLRGFTCYPDGARGGQPLTRIDYKEAVKNKGTIFEEHDICELTGHGGSCGS